MVDAATEFRKSGFTDEESANLALIATMYQNIADEEISAGDAANFIISQMKAFNIEAGNAMHIIDAVNEVSNNYAVSSSDLANNISKVSSALAVGGNTFEQTLGMLTAITEITRNASAAARGLVSVQSRFNQIIDESSSTGQKLIDFYTEHGIAIRDENQQLRSLYDVLYDTSKIWNTLTDDEQKYFLNLQAGANQTRNLAALMENFDVAIAATDTALNSSGSAANENAVAMESLAAKIRMLQAAWQEFATGTIGQDFLGGAINAAISLLEFFNTDVGQAIAKGLLLGSMVGSLTGIVGGFVSNIVAAIKTIKGVIMGAEALLNPTKAIWTAVALGVTVLIAAFVALNDIITSNESAVDRYLSKAQEAAQASQDFADKAVEAEEKLRELNSTPYDERTDDIELEILYLENLIKQYEMLAEARRQEALAEYEKAARHAEKYGLVSKVGFWFEDFVSPEDQAAVANLPTYFSDAAIAANEYANAIGIATTIVDEHGNVVRRLTTEEILSRLSGRGFNLTTITMTLAESTQAAEDYFDALTDIDGATKKDINSAKEFLKTNEDLAKAYRGILENDGVLETQEQAWLDMYDALDKSTTIADAALKTMDELSVELSDGKGFDVSKYNVEAFVQALVDNAELGITSVEDLIGVLNMLGEQGLIDLSSVFGDDWKSEVRGMFDNFDDGEIGVDIDVNSDEAIEEIDNVETELEGLSSHDTILANITNADEARDMASALSTLNDAVDNLDGKSVDISVDINAESAISAFTNLKMTIEGASVNVNVSAETAKSILSEINSTTINDKEFSINCGGNALGVIRSVVSELSSVQSKNVEINVTYKKSYLTGKATGADYWGGGPALINDGAPVNGSSAELVVADGMATVYNNGKETIADIPRGAKIYTAAETQEILNGKSAESFSVPAMANGTRNEAHPDYRLDPTYSGVIGLSGSGEELKKNFDEWLKEKKHFLAMDMITEAQYYRDLEIMNERYLKKMTDYRDDYWSHEEEIYKWRNDSLEKQLELEEKLSDLEKAKSQKVLTYTGGRFQYLQNIEAIAAAQREVDRLTGKYADGTLSARGGLSLVGEKGPELRVLKDGDGIIPANATKNLLSLSRFNAKDIFGAAKSNIMQYMFNISNISLPNVKSSEDFVDGLRNLAYQYSFNRT